MSKILSRKDFGPHGFRWVTLTRIKYKDPRGRVRFWESAERTSRHGEVDGVAIITLVHSKEQPLKVILESQYRPTQGNHVIELPAGLIDKGETAAQAALRELKEETGYVGRVTEVSPICYSDPGMTNANMQFAVVEVDADAPENRNVNPELEDGEFIDVFLLPYDGLYDALVAKQKQTGWDIDARLLLYADAIKRTEMLTGRSASASPAQPSGAAHASHQTAGSAHADTDTPNCQDGMPTGLHIKTRKLPNETDHPDSMQHKSGAQHANGVHAAHPRSPDKHALAEQTHQEGFIDTDPSPAVLKTEFPPKLEPHLEQPHKTQQDSVDGEILLENEVAPGTSGKDTAASPDVQWSRASREQGSSGRSERSSIDLAAGLARSPQKARQDSEDSCEFDSGLFPSFKTATLTTGVARCSTDVFATPFERQGSLIQLEPMHANSGASSSTTGQEAPQNSGDIVYCPVGTPTAKAGSASQPQDQHRGSRQVSDKPKAQSETNCTPASDANMGSQGMLFGAGVAIGGVAGALLTYLGSLQRH